MARKNSGSDLKGVPVAPLTGALDARSSPNLMPAQALRMRQNWQTVGENKLRRGSGWTKFLPTDDYNNADFHDQMLAVQGAGALRQPVTLAFQCQSLSGSRNLFVATQGTIARLNDHNGSWRILGSGYGGTPETSAAAPRFKAARLGDTVVFTNDFEPPMYHLLGQGSSADPEVPLKELPDLAEIGLTRAACVWEWHNVIFLADVEMDGQRFGHRLLWSDFNNGISFDPAVVSSITGTKDLFSHERILAGLPVGNSFFIYTTHGIWEMVVVGGEKSFDFVRRYNGEENEGAGILKYPNTLVAMPNEHLYVAEDGIYTWSPYALQPQRVEFLHRASSLILDDIDQSSCSVHVAFAANNEVLISTAKEGDVDQCPSRTLRVHLTYKTADYIDHGFTCGTTYHRYDVPTLRDWILENGICTLAGLVAAGEAESTDYGYGNEGLPRNPTESEAEFTPNSIYTDVPLTVGDYTVEDYTQLTSATDSLCHLLDGATLDDTCRLCEGKTYLVAASSEDWCLKQFDEVFYREECTNPTAVGSSGTYGYTASAGSYLLNGYDSILRFAPMWQDADGEPLVQVDSLKLQVQPSAAAALAEDEIGLRVGISAEPVDSNDPTELLVWHQHSQQVLARDSASTAAQHAAANTMPTRPIGWTFYRVGRCLHLELKISGTGGDCVLSGIKSEVKLVEANF